MPQVCGTETNPDGTPQAGILIEVIPVPATFIAADGSLVTGCATVRTDDTGEWCLTLTTTEGATPDPSVYKVRRHISCKGCVSPQVFAIAVPNEAGPLDVEGLIVPLPDAALVLFCNDDPLAIASLADAGTGLTASRCDHVHPYTGLATDVELAAETAARIADVDAEQAARVAADAALSATITANDALALHKAGAETVTDTKTFTAVQEFEGGARFGAGPWVDPMSSAFGATGLGVADDLAPFAAARTAALAIGAAVWVNPSAEFRFASAPTTLLTNERIIGAGPGFSKIHFDYTGTTYDATHGWIIDATSASRNNITLSGLTMFGNVGDIAAVASPIGTGVRVQVHNSNTINDLTVTNCEFYNFGVRALGGAEATVANHLRFRFTLNKAHDIGGAGYLRTTQNAGMITPASSSGALIAFNESWDLGDSNTSTDDHCIYFSRQANRPRVIGNDHRSDSTHTCDGVTLGGQTTRSPEVMGNTFFLWMGNAFEIRDVQGGTIVGNTVTAVGTGFLRFVRQNSNANYVTIDSNTFDCGGFSTKTFADLGQTTNTTDGRGIFFTNNKMVNPGTASCDGISVTGTFYDGKIKDNEVFGSPGGSQDYGVSLVWATPNVVTGNQIKDNQFYGNTTGIRLAGTSATLFKSNMVKDNTVSAITTALSGVADNTDNTWLGNVVLSGAITNVVNRQYAVTGRKLFSTAASAIDVSGTNEVVLNFGSVQTISQLIGGVDGQTLTIVARNANASIAHGTGSNQVRFVGGATLNMTDVIVLSLFLDGTVWKERGRVTIT